MTDEAASGGIDPVFIVGMNGSGTTMLADSLGKHPGLYMFPVEVRLLPYFIKRYDRPEGSLKTLAERRHLADVLCAAKPFWQANGRRAARLDDAELDRPGAEATIDAVFRHFALRHGKRRWGEKSPVNLLHMALLVRTFPAARFVHIIRDGRDAAQSFHRRYGYIPAETILRWKQAIDQAREQSALLPPGVYLEIRYEDLTADPEAGMRRVCDHLHLEFDPAVLESSMRMMDPAAMRDAKGIVRNSGKWRAYFTVRDLRRLERVAGRRLAELGYEVGIEGDDTPPRWVRGAWRMQSLTRRSAIFFRRWGWAGMPGFVRSVREFARQWVAGRH